MVKRPKKSHGLNNTVLDVLIFDRKAKEKSRTEFNIVLNIHLDLDVQYLVESPKKSHRLNFIITKDSFRLTITM